MKVLYNKNVKVGTIECGSVFLAPMAGVADVGFRHMCKLGGADLTCTEMINSTALLRDVEKTKELLICSPIETPKAVQIFGHNPKEMAEVCASDYLKNFDIIDINFGCPAPKIVKNGDGSALLNNLPLIKEIVTECVKLSDKPVTCKFRKGFLDGQNVANEVAKICEESGASAITIHGRTREQMYSGNVDLETIAKVKQSVKIPVVGNGDVVDVKTYHQMLATGVDAVMVGRGALGNPNIFNFLKEKEQNIDLLETITKHIEILKNYFSDKYISLTMRKHLLWYISGIENVNKIKPLISTEENIYKSLELIRNVICVNNHNEA